MTLSDGAMERRSERPRKWGAEILAAQLRSHALIQGAGVVTRHSLYD